MRDRNQAARALEGQFLRYREDGDVAALGAVFDGSATELERVARGLVRDRSEAEDLVQATFLTVIERAERWDKSERLMPWLLGILVNHAREARRKRAQTPEPDRLHERVVEEPPTALERAEIRAALTQALSELSPDDRAVLEPVLQEGRHPRELARESGVALGTMRMRLSRALDRLRQRMPASAAFSALIPIPRSPGLEAVRSEVLSCAAKHAGVPVPVAASAAAVIAGIVMTKKFAVVLSLIVILVGAGWLAREFNAPRATDANDRGLAARLESGAPNAAREIAQATDATTPDRTASPSDIVQVRSSADAADATSKLIGRVLDHEGRTIAECALQLMEFRSSDLAGDEFALPEEAAASNRVVRSRATTGADGRFELAGGAHGATHFLLIGAGSSRSSLQAVSAALYAGEVRDLGDIVIERKPEMVGRVLDESGAPVAGVRVRAAALVIGISEMPLHSLLPGWRVLADDKVGFSGVWAPAPVLSSFLANSLISTSVTGEDGRFRVSPAGSKEVVVLLDKPGWRSRRTRTKQVIRDGHDEGDLVLSRGADLAVRVLDQTGAPVSVAEVWWGERGFEDKENVSVVNRSGGLAADGTIVLHGVPDDEDVVVAARRPGSLVWERAFLSAGELAPVVLQLPEPVRLRVKLVDAAQNAIEGGTVSVRPSESALEMQALGLFVVDALSPTSTTSSTFEFEGLAAGRFAVQVRHPRFGSSTQSITLDSESLAQTREIELGGRVVALHVVDDATGTPVEGARIRTDEGEGLGFAFENGEYSLLLNDISAATVVRVEHSEFASTEFTLSRDEAQREVRLVGGGTLVVRVLDLDGQPQAGVDVRLNRSSAFDGREPLLFEPAGRTDASGEVEFTHLAEGDLSVELDEPGARTMNPLDWLGRRNRLDEPRSVPTYVQADRTNFLVVGGPHDLGLCEITGRVTVQGQSSGELVLMVFREGGDMQSLPKLERRSIAPNGGPFSFRGLVPGRYGLSLMRVHSDATAQTSSLHHRSCELTAGNALWVDLDLEVTEARFLVVDPDGRALENTVITSHLDQADIDRVGELGFIRVKTDSTGHATALLVGDGPWKVQAAHSAFGVTQPVFVDTKASAQRIEFTAGVPVNLALEIDEAATLDLDAQYHVVLAKIGGSGQLDREVLFVEGKADVSFGVSEPGSYLLHVIGELGRYFSVVILEVPKSGLSRESVVLTEQSRDGPTPAGRPQ